MFSIDIQGVISNYSNSITKRSAVTSKPTAGDC